mmetsp:Transcript_30848/g.102748  ORF Transcript_30848/g.102748 Transcript_30848/m.102748 type:complete len:89 (+) Transcript_30848:213-479(+)
MHRTAHILVYLVTALVPSDKACFDSSPGKISLAAVSTSRLERVHFLLLRRSFVDSEASRSKMSCMKLFMMPIPRLEMPMSEWICLSTL